MNQSEKKFSWEWSDADTMSHYQHKTHTPLGGQIFVFLVLMLTLFGTIYFANYRKKFEALRQKIHDELEGRGFFKKKVEVGQKLGSVSPLFGWRSSHVSILIWKAWTEKMRSPKSIATYFGWPLMVYALGWLLYARFEAAYSSGELEQYLTVFALLFVTQSTASVIVTEKARKLRQSLRQMGVRDWSYWVQLYMVELSFALVLAVELGVVCGVLKLFHQTGAGYPRPNYLNVSDHLKNVLSLTGLFICYNVAATSFAAFLAAFCASSATASLAAFATAIFALAAFIVVKMAGIVSDAWLLIPAVNLNLAFLGMSSTHAVMPLENYHVSISKSCKYLVLDFFLYVLLAAYGSEVARSGRFLEPILSMFKGTTKRKKKSSLLAEPLLDEEECDFELESAPSETDDVESRRPTVVIRSLRKTFPGGHVAVKGVDLDLYENEIVVLLGHNAAGKSTTLHMLTGLVEPDVTPNRKLTVYGADFFRMRHKLFKFLGICPQHDILWPLLTTREHTVLCASLRSGVISERNDEGDDLLKFFGLEARSAHCGHELSGGMRRKLSTACALAGKSKFVVLDEPTAGVDALARRDFWGLLSKAKMNRTVLLVTHHLDEAEALGDRVAILNAGVLECDGPTDELKKAYPYKLTVRLHRTLLTTPVLPAAAFVLEDSSEEEVLMSDALTTSEESPTFELSNRHQSAAVLSHVERDDEPPSLNGETMTKHKALVKFVLARCPGAEPYDDEDDQTCRRFALPLDATAAFVCVEELQ